jgi:predicted ATPase
MSTDAGVEQAGGGGRDPAGLLGSDREVAALTSMPDQAVVGRGSAVLLRGEAGIGKTALRRLAMVRRYLARTADRNEA